MDIGEDLMLKIKISKMAQRFLDTIPPKLCVEIVKSFLNTGMSPATKKITMKDYPFHCRDFGKYRVVYDFSDGSQRIIFIGKLFD